MITLVIKGDIPAAFKAADAHGVELISIATHNKFKQTIASTIPECLPKVIAWFCEDFNDIDCELSPGSLLFYSGSE